MNIVRREVVKGKGDSFKDIILRHKPEILRTRKESLSVEELLSFASVEELIQVIIERKVSSLAYEGFGRILNWCVEKGIPLEVAAEDLPAVIEIIACRNIIAHNRGAVDERYLEAVPTTALKLGQIRTLSPDDVFTAADLLGKIVESSDTAAVTRVWTHDHTDDQNKGEPNWHEGRLATRHSEGRTRRFAGVCTVSVPARFAGLDRWASRCVRLQRRPRSAIYGRQHSNANVRVRSACVGPRPRFRSDSPWPANLRQLPVRWNWGSRRRRRKAQMIRYLRHGNSRPRVREVAQNAATSVAGAGNSPVLLDEGHAVIEMT